MKQLHRKDLFGWSEFDQAHNVDFHSVLWVRDAGNVLIDPLPMSAHDHDHLQRLGGVNYIIITNSDHCRATEQIVSSTGAQVFAPAGEEDRFPIVCDRWLHDKEEVFEGLIAYQLHGSKTEGELALLLAHHTLITGDLIRCQIAGELCLLADAKLTDKTLAVKSVKSVKRLAELPNITAVLTGDGWPVFSHGSEALHRLARLI